MPTHPQQPRPLHLRGSYTRLGVHAFFVSLQRGHLLLPLQVSHVVIRPPSQATPAASLAAASTSSSIAGVSRPVKVFCWLTW